LAGGARTHDVSLLAPGTAPRGRLQRLAIPTGGVGGGACTQTMPGVRRTSAQHHADHADNKPPDSESPPPQLYRHRRRQQRPQRNGSDASDAGGMRLNIPTESHLLLKVSARTHCVNIRVNVGINIGVNIQVNIQIRGLLF